MKIIHYVNKYKDENGKEIIENLEYKVKNDSEFDMWYNDIKNTYGQYGEVTWEEIDTPKTENELRDEKILNLENELKELQTKPPLKEKVLNNEDVLTDLLTNVIPTLQGGN